MAEERYRRRSKWGRTLLLLGLGAIIVKIGEATIAQRYSTMLGHELIGIVLGTLARIFDALSNAIGHPSPAVIMSQHTMNEAEKVVDRLIDIFTSGLIFLAIPAGIALLKSAKRLPKLSTRGTKSPSRASGAVEPIDLYGSGRRVSKDRDRLRLATDEPLAIFCTICDSKLTYVGDSLALFGGNEVAFMSPRPEPVIRSDYELWSGNVCTKCRSIYCHRCVAPGPTPCPKCTVQTQPAIRAFLKFVGSNGRSDVV